MTTTQFDYLVEEEGYTQAILESNDYICCSSACQAASSSGDPHLTFAHGGKADVRGEHGKTYGERHCLVSR